MSQLGSSIFFSVLSTEIFDIANDIFFRRKTCLFRLSNHFIKGRLVSEELHRINVYLEVDVGGGFVISEEDADGAVK